MKKIASALIACLFLVSCTEKPSENGAVTEDYAKFMPVDHADLAGSWDKYREKSITNRRFKHADLHRVFGSSARWSAEEVGRSIEGLPIYEYKIGQGPTVVFLWSQMHGDESTATMALTDIFNFFEASDKWNDFRDNLLEKLTIVAIPMLNPDGAARFRRRNLLDIDINRDALRLASPEAALLKARRDHYDAVWGFNLHDQNRYYAAGNVPEHATVSFLAPAYNHEKDINESRGNAMRLIGIMQDILQEYIPGQVAKYDDTFEPRAFGDNIQKWGTSTILIESGAMPGDPEKQQIRKLNYVVLLSALQAIANGAYEHKSLKTYEDIPFNNSYRFFDVLVREASIERMGQWFTVDLGFRRSEINNEEATDYYFKGTLADMGDLSTYFAYREIQGQGMQAVAGKVYGTVLNSMADLKKLDPMALLQNGVAYVRLRQKVDPMVQKGLPLVLLDEKNQVPTAVENESNGVVILRKGNQPQLVIARGEVFDLTTEAETIRKNWAAMN